jgi:hypothetical protein
MFVRTESSWTRPLRAWPFLFSPTFLRRAARLLRPIQRRAKTPHGIPAPLASSASSSTHHRCGFSDSCRNQSVRPRMGSPWRWQERRSRAALPLPPPYSFSFFLQAFELLVTMHVAPRIQKISESSTRPNGLDPRLLKRFLVIQTESTCGHDPAASSPRAYKDF